MSLRSHTHIPVPLRFGLLVICAVVLTPHPVWAQCNPSSLSVSPGTIMQGAAYTISDGCPFATLDILYRFNYGGDIEIDGWPTLGPFAQAYIWTDSLTELGTYTFTGVRNSDIGGNFNPSNASITVIAYTPPPQPISLSISPAGVTAGQGAYTMTVGDGANMTLDVQYNLNGNATQTIWGWPSLNGNGQATIYTGSCTTPGRYTYTGIKNVQNDSWVTQGISAAVDVGAPSGPAVSSIAPTGALRGTSVNVTITGSNLCGASLSTSWAGLAISNVSSWLDTSLTATFTVASSAPVGWAPITVTSRSQSTSVNFAVTSAAPTVTTLNPSGALPGTSQLVTLFGTNLTGANISTTWGGLSVSGAQSASNGSSVTALFAVAATAATGNPPIVVTTAAGSTTTQAFTIKVPPTLSKEYVYLGERLLSVLSTAPPQPVSAPRNLTLQYTSATSVALSWTSPATSGNGGVAGYKVYRDDALISGSALIPGTSFTDAFLAANAGYSYTVVAYDNAGNPSPASPARSVFRDNFNRSDWNTMSSPHWWQSDAWQIIGNAAFQEYSGISGFRDALTQKSFGSFKATYAITEFGYGPCPGLTFWHNGPNRYRLCVYDNDMSLAYYGPGGAGLAYISGYGRGTTFRVEADSATRNIKVYVDGILKIDVIDPNTGRSNFGRLGLCNATPDWGISIRIDNLVIEEKP